MAQPGGIFHNISVFPIAKERGNYSLTTSVSITWTVADDSKPLLSDVKQLNAKFTFIAVLREKNGWNCIVSQKLSN